MPPRDFHARRLAANNSQRRLQLKFSSIMLVLVIHRAALTCVRFSGIGGLDLGVSPWVHFGRYCERDQQCRKVLRKRMDNAALSEGTIHDNVETFQPCWPCDIVVGGFPCQDISAAGKQKGVVEGKRSCLYTHLVRVANQCGCPFIFMENVANIVGKTMVKA